MKTSRHANSRRRISHSADRAYVLLYVLPAARDRIVARPTPEPEVLVPATPPPSSRPFVRRKSIRSPDGAFDVSEDDDAAPCYFVSDPSSTRRAEHGREAARSTRHATTRIGGPRVIKYPGASWSLNTFNLALFRFQNIVTH